MEVYVLPFKENIMYQDSNLGFKDKLSYIVLVGLKKALGAKREDKKGKEKKRKKSLGGIGSFGPIPCYC